ncbi:MAG: P-II family nitrogen regulator [Campylobacterales bacterium]
MVSMKKVEIIFEAVYLTRLLELFKRHNIKGYTLIREIEGCGAHGLMSADVGFDVSSNDYLYTVCENDKFEEMKEEIRSFTHKYGGKCFVTDAMMLK